MKKWIVASALLIIILSVGVSSRVAAQSGGYYRPHISLKVWLPPLPRITPPRIIPPHIVFDGGGYAPAPEPAYADPQPYVQDNYDRGYTPPPVYNQPAPAPYVQDGYDRDYAPAPVYVAPRPRYYARGYSQGCAPRYEQHRRYDHDNYRGGQRHYEDRYR